MIANGDIPELVRLFDDIHEQCTWSQLFDFLHCQQQLLWASLKLMKYLQITIKFDSNSYSRSLRRLYVKKKNELQHYGDDGKTKKYDWHCKCCNLQISNFQPIAIFTSLIPANCTETIAVWLKDTHCIVRTKIMYNRTGTDHTQIWLYLILLSMQH